MKKQEDVLDALIALALGPAGIWILFERFNWIIWPRCRKLSSKLKSIKAIMDVCEISTAEFDLLSRQVS